MKFISEEKLKQLLREAFNEGLNADVWDSLSFTFDKEKLEAKLDEMSTRIAAEADKWE